MSVPKHYRITAVLFAFLCLMVTIGYSSITSEVRAEPPGDQPEDTPPDLSPNLPPLTVAEPNDRCGDAEEVKPFIILPMPGQTYNPPDDYTVSVNDRKFQNGNSVDDWYSYTTHELDCTTMLRVTMTSDKPQTEIEIYDYCFRWPLASSMYEEFIGFDDEGSTIEPLSGLNKEIAVTDVLPEFTYYIHVNCLYRPDDGGTITYDLTIKEECLPIPTSGEIDSGRVMRRIE